MANEGSYIDLKQVDFYLQDGFLANGVNTNLAAIGATTLTAVTGIVGLIPAGVLLAFPGDLTPYSVVSTTLTGGNVTSITFTPPLTIAVAAGETFIAGPNQLKIKIGEGNLTYSEKVTREYKKDRGKLDQVRDGEEMPMDVNFQFAFLFLSSPSGAATPTIEEFFYQSGPAATFVSTGALCEPYSVNIVLVNNGNPGTCAGVLNPHEKISLLQYRYEDLAHDVKAGTVSSTGKCNIRKAVKLRY